MKLVLNREAVRAAAIAAYDAKNLSAQQPHDTPNSACLYRDDNGHPCAIGAAMTDEEAAEIARLGHNGTGVATFFPHGLYYKDVQVETDDHTFLDWLQEAHDEWTNNRTFEHEARFLAVLDHAPQAPSAA